VDEVKVNVIHAEATQAFLAGFDDIAISKMLGGNLEVMNKFSRFAFVSRTARPSNSSACPLA